MAEVGTCWRTRGAPGQETTERWRYLLTGGTFLVLYLLTSCYPPFWLILFCMPAAYLSAIFLGIPLVTATDGFALLSESLPIMVTLQCSGATFFSLLVALMLGAIAKSRHPRDLLGASWVVPMAYVITIAANTSRIVLAWMAGRFSRAFFPESLWGGVHYGVGVVVFVSFLIVSYTVVTWRSTHVFREP